MVSRCFSDSVGCNSVGRARLASGSNKPRFDYRNWSGSSVRNVLEILSDYAYYNRQSFEC